MRSSKGAIDALSQLPEDEQEHLAELILLEIRDAAKWDGSFERHPEVLHKLAEEARDEYRAGKTEPLDPDKF